MSVRTPLAAVVAVAALLAAAPAASAVEVVDDDGGDCPSAHAGIQAAVTAADPGETIYICPGDYEVGSPTATTADNLLEIDKSVDLVGAGAALVTITGPAALDISDEVQLSDVPDDGGHMIAVKDDATVDISGVTVDSRDTQVDGGVAFLDGQGSLTNSRVTGTGASARANDVDTGAAVVATAEGDGGESVIEVDGVLVEDHGIAGIAAVRRAGGTRTLRVNVSDSRIIGSGRQDEHDQIGVAAAQGVLAPAVDVDITDSLLAANTTNGFLVLGVVPETASVTGSSIERR